MFNCENLNKVMEEVGPFFENNDKKMNEISEDILQLERYFQSISFPKSFSFSASDSLKIVWCSETQRLRLIWSDDHGLSFDKPVMECKFNQRRFVHENLPLFLDIFAQSLDKGEI